MLGIPEDINEALTLEKELNYFDHISIHSSSKDIRYSGKINQFLNKLKKLTERIQANYIVFHPDLIDDITILKTL